MANILSQVKVILGIETQGFPTVRQQVRGLTQGVQREFAQLKTFVGGFFTAQFGVELVRSVVQMTNHIKDLSEQTGETTTDIQKWGAAFKSVGLGAEDAAAAFEVLIQKRKEALEDGGKAAEFFRKFGIGEEQLRGMTKGSEIAAAIGKNANPNSVADREAFGEAFGTKRGGKVLAGINAFNEGEGEKVEIISEQAIKEIDAAAKAMERAMHDFKVAAVPLVTGLLSWAKAAVDWMTGKRENYTNITKWTPAGLLAQGAEWLTRPDYKEAETVDPAVRAAARAEMSGADPGELAPAEAPSSSIMAEEYSADRKKREEKAAKEREKYLEALDESRTGLQKSVFGAMFSAGNSDDKMRSLDERLAKLNEDALVEDAKGSEEGAKNAGSIRREMVSLAAEKAGLLAGTGVNVQPDSLARVGGMIGGAVGGIDPSLTAAQQTVDILQKILAEFPALETALRESRPQPKDRLR